jgi:hypothetical protein
VCLCVYVHICVYIYVYVYICVYILYICVYICMGNSGIARWVGVHMHPTIGSSTCNIVVSKSSTSVTNAVI